MSPKSNWSRTAAKRFFAEAALGHDLIETREEARARSASKFGVVVEKYLAARQPESRPNTIRHQWRYLRRYFAPPQGYVLADVTPREAAVLIGELAEQRGKTAAKKKAWAAMPNPVAFTNSPSPGEKRRERVLKPEVRCSFLAFGLPDNCEEVRRGRWPPYRRGSQRRTVKVVSASRRIGTSNVVSPSLLMNLRAAALLGKTGY
jgi:hypothetical protein